MPLLLLLLLPLLWAQGEGQCRPDQFEPACPSGHGNCELQVTKSVTVQEGLCGLVPCTISSFSDSGVPTHYGYWFPVGANTDRDSPVATNNLHRKAQKTAQDRFLLLWDWATRNCSLAISGAQRNDSGSYFFRLEHGSFRWNYCRYQITLNVTALTQTPDILFSGILEAGRPSNLTCSVSWACEQGTPPTFSWMSSAFMSKGPTTHHSSVITLMPRLQDHGTNLTCQVMLPGSGITVKRTIQLNITGTKTTSELVKGAIGGAGVTALLAGCLYLIFFVVKTLRKKAARTAVSTSNSEPAIGPGSLGHQQEFQPRGHTGPSDSSGAKPTSEKEQEVHYASLSFHRPYAQKNSSTK